MYVYGRATGLSGGLGASKGVSKDQAKKAVQSIYLELLLRDPWNPYDAGAEGYVNCLIEGWCSTDFVRQELIKSSEYRDKELQRAQAVYGPGGSASSALVPGSVAASMPYGASSQAGYAPAGGGILSMTIGGIPVVFLAGGALLLSLLKKR